jgi:hypothetical protein
LYTLYSQPAPPPVGYIRRPDLFGTSSLHFKLENIFNHLWESQIQNYKRLSSTVIWCSRFEKKHVRVLFVHFFRFCRCNVVLEGNIKFNFRVFWICWTFSNYKLWLLTLQCRTKNTKMCTKFWTYLLNWKYQRNKEQTKTKWTIPIL